jgi:hypothetical protein
MSSCNQYSREKYTPTKWKLVSRFPPIQELANAVWPMSSCNIHHESTVSGRGGQYHRTVHFLLYAIVSGNRISYTNLTNSPLLPMVTMNQLNLVKGEPGIIALHSLLYLQPCWVTAICISPCRISLTNLPLLLHVWYKSHQFAAVAVHRCHL